MFQQNINFDDLSIVLLYSLSWIRCSKTTYCSLLSCHDRRALLLPLRKRGILNFRKNRSIPSTTPLRGRHSFASSFTSSFASAFASASTSSFDSIVVPSSSGVIVACLTCSLSIHKNARSIRAVTCPRITSLSRSGILICFTVLSIKSRTEGGYSRSRLRKSSFCKGSKYL